MRSMFLGLARGLAVLFLIAVSTGCYSVESPSEPRGGNCNSGRPTLAAVVSPSAPACDQGACRAGFTLTTASTLSRISWSFTNGSPSSSGAQSGVVQYPRPSIFPASFAWSVTGCTCSESDDPDGNSCRTETGSVVFQSPL